MGPTGWNNRVEYEPGTGALALFPNVHLETCDASVASVQVAVELETSHIGKGCDRDTYSEKSLHRLCGKEGPSRPEVRLKGPVVYVCVLGTTVLRPVLFLTYVESPRNRGYVSRVSFK